MGKPLFKNAVSQKTLSNVKSPIQPSTALLAAADQQLKMRNRGGSDFVGSDWQRLFIVNPQLNLPPPELFVKQRGKSALNTYHGKSPSRGFANDQQILLLDQKSDVYLVNPKARNTMGQINQSKYQVKEERDLQRAILSIHSFAQNSSLDFNMAKNPTYYNLLSQKGPKLAELAHKRPLDQPFNFVNTKKNFSENVSLKPNSPSGTVLRKRKRSKKSMESENSKSRSPKTVSPIDERVILGLPQELKDQVNRKKLLVNNNFSKMLQQVHLMKLNSDNTHKTNQTANLAQTLNQNALQAMQKGLNQQNRVLKEFVETTDLKIQNQRNNFQKTIQPQSQHGWQFKDPLQPKGLKTKIYTSDIYNPRNVITAQTLQQKRMSELMNVLSKSTSPKGRKSSDESKNKSSQIKFKNTNKPYADPNINQIKFEDDSYEQYIQNLSQQNNMQHMISQNLIKVKYIMDGEKSSTQEFTNNNSIASMRTMNEDINNNQNKSPNFDDDEKLIQDFISERDQFNMKQRKKNRLIFNLNNSDKDSRLDAIEIGQVSLKDFLKQNRINPKIFLFENVETQEVNPTSNKKQYYVQKAVHLLQTQKISQARTFLINAVKEFPQEPSLLFNKGLVHYFNSEFKESCKIYYELLKTLKSKNQVLVNMVLSHLQLKEYEVILDLQDQIEKKEDYLDINEKQLRMMTLFAQEKLKNDDFDRFQAYMKLKREKKDSVPFEVGEQEVEQQSQITFQINNDLTADFGFQRYLNTNEERQITIVDEQFSQLDKNLAGEFKLTHENSKPALNQESSADDVIHYSQNSQADQILIDHESYSHLMHGNLFGKLQSKVQFSQKYDPQQNENVLPENTLRKLYYEDDESVEDLNPRMDPKDERQLQADIVAMIKDCGGVSNLIPLMEKFQKLKKGSTRTVLDKREEFYFFKYSNAINHMVELRSKYYFLKYLKPEKDTDQQYIKVDPKNFMFKEGPELENAEGKLMQLIGMPKDKIEERHQKHKQHIRTQSHALIQEVNLKEVKNDIESNEFSQKTSDFINFLFNEYGLKEVIVAGTENASIFQDIRNVDQLNAYVNRISEFMTSKTIYLANEKHKIQNEEEQQQKKNEKEKKYTKGYDSDKSDVNIEDQIGEFEDDNPQHQLESFQNVLEMKVIEMFSNQNYEEANFYQSLLQKLNAIDLLQLFLKQCAKKVKSGEKLLTFKKELSFGMLQIFREQICKKEINDRNIALNNKSREFVDFDLIDKTVRRLRFFKNFAQSIRHKLYSISRYEIIPPGKVIANQEEFTSHIFVVISGIASLTVKYLETNESYSGMLIYPGDAIGDANIKDKIVISKGRGEAKTYLSSVKECDVLVFDRKVFTDVLFKDMMDSLYEKIIAMRSSEFFENLSPYAMVILCSNVELCEYSYGDVILRQETEPKECYIIIQGECKLVLETVIYKQKEEQSSKKSSYSMKFGKQIYNPSEIYGKKKNQGQEMVVLNSQKEKQLVNQRKLNEKYSFQHEFLDFPQDISENSPMLRAPVINNTDIPFSEQKHGSKMIAYRHHLYYDKLVQGKVMCSRALLEKDYAKKFIQKKFDHFKEQLNCQTKLNSPTQKSPHQHLRNSISKKKEIAPEMPAEDEQEQAILENNLKLNSPLKLSLIEESKLPQDQRENDAEISEMYSTLMKSQLTVIADQAVVKVLKLTRKSKKYLSDPLKAMIDNKIYENKFKDYDRPFKNEEEVQKFIEGQRRWEHYKDRLSKNFISKYVFK